MKWFYFDANALAKRYSQEIGTDLINEVFRQISLSSITCLSLSILETPPILVRKKNDGRLPKLAFDQAMINFHAELIDAPEFVPATINDPLVFSALDFIAKHNINSTDAVILRSVLNMKERPFRPRKSKNSVQALLLLFCSRSITDGRGLSFRLKSPFGRNPFTI